jgi:hypothetical protein
MFPLVRCALFAIGHYMTLCLFLLCPSHNGVIITTYILPNTRGANHVHCIWRVISFSYGLNNSNLGLLTIFPTIPYGDCIKNILHSSISCNEYYFNEKFEIVEGKRIEMCKTTYNAPCQERSLKIFQDISMFVCKLEWANRFTAQSQKYTFS